MPHFANLDIFWNMTFWLLPCLQCFWATVNSKLSPFIILIVYNHFQVYLAGSRTCKWKIYVFSIPFKNSYGCIGIFGDTYIIDDYNLCKPINPIIRLFLEFIWKEQIWFLGRYETPFRFPNVYKNLRDIRAFSWGTPNMLMLLLR